jgi:hypothetical protein
LRKTRPLLPPRIDDRAFRQLLGFLFVVLLTAGRAIASDFRFDRDTFAFANETVFEYHDGHPHLREPSAIKQRPEALYQPLFRHDRAAVKAN